MKKMETVESSTFGAAIGYSSGKNNSSLKTPPNKQTGNLNISEHETFY